MSDPKYRTAAVELCMLRGLDPHEVVEHPDSQGWAQYVPRWHIAVDELIDAERLQLALKLVE